MGQIMIITDADTAAAQPARGRGGGTSQIPEPVACDGRGGTLTMILREDPGQAAAETGID